MRNAVLQNRRQLNRTTEVERLKLVAREFLWRNDGWRRQTCDGERPD